jgi:putative transposase
VSVSFAFVAMEIGSRRILPFNVTEHPTADWTLQQLRETAQGITAIGSSFTTSRRVSRLNWMSASTSTRVLRCLVAAATANPQCERLVGSIRREWLDFVIPIHEWHLRRTFRQSSTHYSTAVLIGQSDLASRMRLTEKLPVCDRRHDTPVGSRLA